MAALSGVGSQVLGLPARFSSSSATNTSTRATRRTNRATATRVVTKSSGGKNTFKKIQRQQHGLSMPLSLRSVPLATTRSEVNAKVRHLLLVCKASSSDSVFFSADDLELETWAELAGKKGSSSSSSSSCSEGQRQVTSMSSSGGGGAEKEGKQKDSSRIVSAAANADAGDKGTDVSAELDLGDDGGNGNGDGDEGGGGGGGDDENEGGSGGSDGEDEDSLLPLEEAEKLLGKDAKLPDDWQALARQGGIRQGVLVKYLALIKAGGYIGHLVGKFPVLRDRLIVDNRFLFKVLTEVLIDSGCATFAEVKKRGDVFWDEFEFYLSDLVVGIFLDVALVTLLAPTCMAGASTIVKAAGSSKGLAKYTNMLLKLNKSLPSAVFEKSIKGVRVYSTQQRVVAFLYKGFEYAAVGFACGLVGQSMANTAMIAKRAYNKSKQASISAESAVSGAEAVENMIPDEVAVPPLFRTACVWALFMGASSNARYQAVFGLERLVEGTTLAKKVPMIANLATVAIRFANNIYGGEQFIDMARFFGIQ